MNYFSFGSINLKTKNIKMGKYNSTDKAVSKWFMVATLNNMLMNRLVPHAKANDSAKALSMSTFKASNDWLG